MYVNQSVIACLLTTAFLAGCSGGGDDNSDTASSQIAGQISTSLSGSDTSSGRTEPLSKYDGNYVT